MPTLLRYDAIRLFEASVEALHIAIVSLGSGKRVVFRQQSAEYAIETGLIGTAAELAMSACLVQAHGPDAILWPSGRYKAASEVLSEFRTLATQSTAASSFLTVGVADPPAHRAVLSQATKAFRLMISMRAGGLHAGRGLLHEAIVVQANHVADFLETLAASRRIGPYLCHVPRCLWYSRDRTLVIEDLKARLAESSGDEQTATLSSVYCVLPDMPNEEPEWMQAFSRVSIAPKVRDIEYLMETLEHALPAALRRTTTAQGEVPVRVAPDDPEALPIAPHYLRRQFNEIVDLWYSDIATANGRLNQGGVDLPPQYAVLDVFALGLERSGVLKEGRLLTAHDAWPHVLASFMVQGTIGPYWFLVRSCGDLGQLMAILRRAAHGRKRPMTRLGECFHGLQVLRDGSQLPEDDPYFAELITECKAGQGDWDWLINRCDHFKNTDRALPETLHSQLATVADGGEPVGTLILSLLETETTDTCLTYWLRTLAEQAGEADDTPGLVALLSSPVTAAHTTARKALRRIDFSVYGPPLLEIADA